MYGFGGAAEVEAKSVTEGREAGERERRMGWDARMDQDVGRQKVIM